MALVIDKANILEMKCENKQNILEMKCENKQHTT